MGVPKVNFRTISIGGVWRPSTISTRVPTIDVASGLRWLAKAKKEEGRAEAAKYAAISDAITSGVTAATKIATTYIGIKHEQKKRAAEDGVRLFSYRKMCNQDPSAYNPEIMMKLEKQYNSSLARSQSLGVWRKSTEEIAEDEHLSAMVFDEKNSDGLKNRVLDIKMKRDMEGMEDERREDDQQ